MILYKNKRRGRRSIIGGPSKLGGINTIKVREMNDPELYPPGPHMQFNFGENRELSLEISYHDAIELKAKIDAFLRTAEKEYCERIESGSAGPIEKRFAPDHRGPAACQ